MSWLKPVELKSDIVELKLLQKEDKAELLESASDGELCKLWYTQVPSVKTIDNYIDTALEQYKNQTSLPFTIRCSQTGKVLGCTRYCNADTKNKRVEIGYTWYRKSVQRTAINTACKLLLLQNAFENLNVIAVEFRTHWMNQTSRNAILRLGAKQDGVLRNHQQMADGSYRDTVVFSILNSEWPAVKNQLKFRLGID